MLSRFHLIPERHGQTDGGRTHGRTKLLYQYRASVCWWAIKTIVTTSVYTCTSFYQSTCRLKRTEQNLIVRIVKSEAEVTNDKRLRSSYCTVDHMQTQPRVLSATAELVWLRLIGPTNRKNWLTFGYDPVPDTDSGSLFHFPHHCIIFWDLLTFLIQSPADFHDTRRSDWRRQDNESTTFWERSGRHPDSNPD